MLRRFFRISRNPRVIEKPYPFLPAPILDREEILVIDSVTIATPFFATSPSSSKLEKRIVTDSVPIATPFFQWWNSQDRVHFEFFTDFSRTQQKNQAPFRGPEYGK
ncbi:hypothetical protein AVEN_129618-1 [Araneus ventricosus]|uniref:Uncharacterized protein n=1 Tax=Araneus ventricosus TaxID=182803 RepID=A0A4Y2FJK3_ARAVE|nr:hypothetical protein AVEN_129618-1 [Araneus ventricosus]